MFFVLLMASSLALPPDPPAPPPRKDHGPGTSGGGVSVAEHTAVSLAIQVPVVQSLLEEQQEALYKVTLGFDLTF